MMENDEPEVVVMSFREYEYLALAQSNTQEREKKESENDEAGSLFSGGAHAGHAPLEEGENGEGNSFLSEEGRSLFDDSAGDFSAEEDDDRAFFDSFAGARLQNSVEERVQDRAILDAPGRLAEQDFSPAAEDARDRVMLRDIQTGRDAEPLSYGIKKDSAAGEGGDARIPRLEDIQLSDLPI